MTGSPGELTIVLLLSITLFLSAWHIVWRLFG
jgi:hypothetical protein